METYLRIIRNNDCLIYIYLKYFNYNLTKKSIIAIPKLNNFKVKSLCNMARFSFSAKVCNQQKIFTFEVPSNGLFVVTNRFCPKEFLVPKNSLYNAVTPLNGETILEFKQDCENFVNYINTSSQNISNVKMSVYLDALDRLLIAHLNRCGRLIFNDFLIYLDIYSYFIFADGVIEDKVRLNYPRVAYKYLNSLKDSLKDSQTLSPLSQTDMAGMIKRLNKESEQKLGITDYPNNSTPRNLNKQQPNHTNQAQTPKRTQRSDNRIWHNLLEWFKNLF